MDTITPINLPTTAAKLAKDLRDGDRLPLRFTSSDGYTVDITDETNGWVYLTGPDETDLGRYTSAQLALDAAARVAHAVELLTPTEVDAVMVDTRRLATMGPKNMARAERGELAMRAFFGHAEGSLSDLLTDLYAYAQREGLTWETCQAIAAQRYANETPKG